MTDILRYEVTTSDGKWRRFATFELAERWARKHVAASADEKFAQYASIFGPEWEAYVCLDGNNRVWTDVR